MILSPCLNDYIDNLFSSNLQKHSFAIFHMENILNLPDVTIFEHDISPCLKNKGLMTFQQDLYHSNTFHEVFHSALNKLCISHTSHAASVQTDSTSCYCSSDGSKFIWKITLQDNVLKVTKDVDFVVLNVCRSDLQFNDQGHKGRTVDRFIF